MGPLAGLVEQSRTLIAAACGASAGAVSACNDTTLRLVLVEFADQWDQKAPFGGSRYQYVNLSSQRLLPVDPVIRSRNQLKRTPPITVRVVPPQRATVRLKLTREEGLHEFPAGSAVLSRRERGLRHLEWAENERTYHTDANGELLVQPGLPISALAGFTYHVEGALPGEAFRRSSNYVFVRRRIYIRPVVRYAAARVMAAVAIEHICNYLDLRDVEVELKPELIGRELGVLKESQVRPSVERIGRDALASPAEIHDLRPHCIAVIIGEFVADEVETHNFELEVTRPLPSSVEIPLERGDTSYYLMPLADGSQFVRATVSGGRRSRVELERNEVSPLDRFTDTVTVDLSRILATHGTASRLTISLRLKVVRYWAVGWAYPGASVVYLNMRDPATNAILAANMAAALVIHELGHKFGLTSEGGGNRPDVAAHHYGTFNRHGVNHVGPHCKLGVSAALWSDDADDQATCTMWGALKTIREYCPECSTTLRKVDLSRFY